MRRFTRTPYYTGPDDPEISQVRGTLELGEMVSLIADRYDTTAEYANLIVGTIADARPGYSAGGMNTRGQPRNHQYVTCQLVVTRELRRTGNPYQP